MAAAPELVPLIGRAVLRPLLVPFAVLAGYFVAWGLVFCMDAVVRAFFGTVSGTLGWIPFAGKIITSPINAIEHKLTSFLGGLERHFENTMATRWYQLGDVLSRWAADAEAAAVLSYHLAKRLSYLYGELATGKLGGRAQAWVRHEVARLLGGHAHTIRIVEKRVVNVTRYVGAKTGTLAGELGHVIEWDIPRLRARTKALERSVGRLWTWTRTHPLAIPEAVATALVAAALARLGGSWIRCSNWNRIGRSVCRTPLGDIDALLGLLVAGAVIADFRELVKLGQHVERGVASALQEVAKL